MRKLWLLAATSLGCVCTACLVAGCASACHDCFAKVSNGMSKQEVRQKCGRPYDTQSTDSGEVWIYRDVEIYFDFVGFVYAFQGSSDPCADDSDPAFNLSGSGPPNWSTGPTNGISPP